MHSLKVTFQPGGETVYVLPGTSLLEAAARAGIIIDAVCGGKGTCGKCRVQVLNDKVKPTSLEKIVFSSLELSQGFRLACQTKVNTSLIVTVPLQSRFSAQKILESGYEGEREIIPSIEKTYLKLPKRNMENQIADLEVLRKSVKRPFYTQIEVIRNLPQILTEDSTGPTLVFSAGELLSVEKGDTTKENYGLAFDLGTTTMVGTLLDVNTGKDLAVTSRMNPQVIWGDDVVSRIKFCREDKDGLEKLHLCLIKEINLMITDLTEKAQISPEHIYKITVVGNSTMEHLFLQISPENLGVIPFTPVFKRAIALKATKLGLKVNKQGEVFVFPNMAGFIGGDTVAVILATSIHKSKEIKLIVDIGTNGEIVLGNKERLVAASTAAGPAFEGARISSGMRATKGAIEKVLMEDDIEVNVIGDILPFGLCGSGLIDAVGEMVKLGIINDTGRILVKEELENKVSLKLAERVITINSNNNFLLVSKEGTDNKKPIFITQKDVRELQLAKAAIAAGIKILKKELGIKTQDIKEVLLAGAFGNFIRSSQAKRIGLIPDLPSEKIKFVGNAASSGAKLALLSRDKEKETALISEITEYIELSLKREFQTEFVEAMFFPVGEDKTILTRK